MNKGREQRKKTGKNPAGFCIVFFLLSSVLCSLPSVSCAESISSTELIQNAAQYDNKIVAYEGELIGSELRRGDFAWLNLHDGQNAIGVWATGSQIKDIRYGGNYKMRGDWVRVRGIFHRACVEHGGALDIHADDVVVVRQGGAVSEALDQRKIFLMVFLLGVLACLLIIRILQKRRRTG